jgi:hypothetical protein
MSKQRLHGVVSLGLVGVSIGIALVVMFRAAWGWGVLYVAISAASGYGIVYAYCAKCPCKVRCGHVLPGKAAQRFKRQPGPYTATDNMILVLGLIGVIALPQIWLWRDPALFGVFWLLTGIALVDILRVVCRACNNIYCPLQQMRRA